MKTGALIIIGTMCVVGIGCLAYLSHDLTYVNSNPTLADDEKYQYKFETKSIKLPDDGQLTKPLFQYSHDGGNTFSAPIDMTVGENMESTGGSMIQYDGIVLISWHQEYDGVTKIVFAKSDDRGLTFEKTPLYAGAHPKMFHYDDVLYLSWIEDRKISYVFSDDIGKSFSVPISIFDPRYDFSPFAMHPDPEFVVGDGFVKIVWESSTPTGQEQFEYIVNDPEENLGGPGNRNPEFFGFYVSKYCDDAMIKHMKKHTNMFSHDENLMVNFIGLPENILDNEYAVCFEDTKNNREASRQGVKQNLDLPSYTKMGSTYGIQFNQEFYQLGDDVRVSGRIADISNAYVVLSVTDPYGQIIEHEQVDLDAQKRFTYEFETSSNYELGSYEVEILDDNKPIYEKSFEMFSYNYEDIYDESLQDGFS